MKVKDQIESFFSNFNNFNPVENNNNNINMINSINTNFNCIDNNYNFKDEKLDNDIEIVNNININKNNNNVIYRKDENIENEKNKKNKIINDKGNNSIYSNDYEDLLRKHESDIRNHIKIQHQYRIYSDNLKNKIEELEKSKLEYKKTIVNLQEVISIH